MQNSQELVGKYKEIIKKMDYGTNNETSPGISELIAECLNFIYYPEDKPIEIFDVISGKVIAGIFKTIENNKCNENVSFECYDKKNFILKLIEDISKSVSLICYLEVVTKGVLLKDTTNVAIPIVKTCLQNYICHNIPADKSNKENYGEFCIPNDFFLGHFGSIFGKCISNGSPIHLNCEPQMVLTAYLFAKLCINSGYPKDMIRIKLVTKCEHIKKFECHKISNKTPMIIFNDADLNSACVTAIDGIWGSQGKLPWTINTILVQEDVFLEFLNKFKHQMKRLRYSLPYDKFTDISLPRSANALQKLNAMIKNAESLGIEVFQSDVNMNDYQPTIFIGEYVYDNNAIIPNDCLDIPYATILPFRNITEAIKFANNCRQNLAASVWTENIGTANEVARKLCVNHVWINCFGMFPTNIITPTSYKTNELSEELINYKDIIKDQTYWKNCSYNERLLKMFKLEELLSQNQKKMCANFLRDTLTKYQLLKNPVSPKENYFVSTQIVPLNVFYIKHPPVELTIPDDHHESLFWALLHGNAVVIRSDFNNILEKKLLSECQIPTNLVTMVSSEQTNGKLEKIFVKYCKNDGVNFCKNIDNYCNVKYIWQTSN